MKYEIRNRFTRSVQLTAEIDCDENTATSVKIGLAVKWAIGARADLTGADLTGADLTGADLAYANLAYANLTGANLTGANLAYANLARADLTGTDLTGANLARADLTGANLARADLTGTDLTGTDLTGANLIDGGQRSDGYRFVGWIENGELQIHAGRRSLNVEQARKHWKDTHSGTPLGDETFVILDHIESVARIRGLVVNREEVAE